MLRKSLLYSVIAIATINPLVIFATSQADTTATTSTTNTVATTNNTQGAMSDTEITNQIKALYQKSPLVREQNITVTTTNHQVVLRGKVDTDMGYERAVSLAESVAGVGEVNADNLLVKDSKSPLADTLITAKVKGTIMKEKLFGDKDVEYWPVSVETKDGIVYLAGDVDTDEQRNNIANLAKNVKGVKSVQSSLTIKKNNNGDNAKMGTNNQNDSNNSSDNSSINSNK